MTTERYTFVAWLVGVLMGLSVALISITNVSTSVRQPHCPTEDSCIVDHHDGAYHITEDTP